MVQKTPVDAFIKVRQYLFGGNNDINGNSMIDESTMTKELVDRARNLDPEAFGQLYDMYYDSIYKYAYFKCGNQADAEDLASQVFTGALRTIKNFSWRKATFASWLFRIAHNVVVDYWRKRGQSVTEPIENHAGIADGTDVARTVVKSLQYEKVRLAMGLLADDQSQVLTLRFINGLSIQETASALDKTVGAIKAQQFRAVAKLRELLAGEVDE